MAERTSRLLILAVALGLSGPAFGNEDVARLAADPANAVMPNLSYSGWNFSELDLLTPANVAGLTLVWTWQIGLLDSHEAPPVVVGGTMYLVSPKPNYVYALDLASEGVIKWEFRPDNIDAVLAAEAACCGGPTRGLYYAEGKLFYATLDGHIFALDADTGEIVWQADAGELETGETSFGNGLVVGNLFVVGNAGADRGVRGRVRAFDIGTGAVAWTMYSMGPDADVGIGPRFSPFYADDRAGSVATWYGESWRTGGGTVSGYFTFDPASNFLHYSAGTCAPSNPDYRREWGVVTLDENGGLIDYRNNWCASELARDATTGELIWAYNLTPGDNWGLDEPVTTLLLDLPIGGTERHTAVKAARNGYFYVWDRDTGELLTDPWPFRYVDFMTGVDRATGRALYDISRWNFTDIADRRRYTEAGALPAGQQAPQNYTGTEVNWCPGFGARDWQNDAWSPLTGLVYTSTITGCATAVVIEGEYNLGAPYTLRRGAGPAPMPRAGVDGRPVPYVHELQANDPVSGMTVWTHPWEQPNNMPVLATASGLLFQLGSDQGVVRALDATDGEILWTFRIGGRGNVSPVTYLGPDGQQYVAFINSAPPGTAVVNADAAGNDAARFQRSGAVLNVFALP